MIAKLLTEYHLEFQSLKGGCTGSSKSTHVKIPHCWKSHVTAHVIISRVSNSMDPDQLAFFSGASLSWSILLYNIQGKCQHTVHMQNLMPFLKKNQCRPRSAGFCWSQLVRNYTVFPPHIELVLEFSKKRGDKTWLNLYPARQGLP